MRSAIDTVHVSTAPANIEISQAFRPRYANPELTDEHTSALVRAIRKGEAPLRSEMPVEQVAFRDDVHVAPVILCGFLCVSDEIAKCFEGFDLGSGYLHRIPFLNQNGKTIGNYSIVVFGNRREAFLPEQSPNTSKSPYSKTQWSTPFVTKDDDITVKAESVSPPDMWVDPRLLQTFFVSGRLAATLTESGHAGSLQLSRCRIS